MNSCLWEFSSLSLWQQHATNRHTARPQWAQMPRQQPCHLTTIMTTPQTPHELVCRVKSTGNNTWQTGTQPHLQRAQMPHQQPHHLTTTMTSPQTPHKLMFVGFFILDKLWLQSTDKLACDTFMTGTSTNLTIAPPCCYHYGPLDALWTSVCRVFSFLRALATTHDKPAHNTSTMGTNATSTTTPHYHHSNPSDALWTHVCEVFLILDTLMKLAHNASAMGMNATLTTMLPHYHHHNPSWTHICGVFFILNTLTTTHDKPAHHMSAMDTNTKSITTPPHAYHHDPATTRIWAEKQKMTLALPHGASALRSDVGLDQVQAAPDTDHAHHQRVLQDSLESFKPLGWHQG